MIIMVQTKLRPESSVPNVFFESLNPPLAFIYIFGLFLKKKNLAESLFAACGPFEERLATHSLISA